MSTNFAKPPELLRRTPVTIRSELKGEDWQHENLGLNHWCCSWPPASLTTCACQADPARPTNEGR